MRAVITTVLLAFAGILSYGQTIGISGTVSNQKGQPVPYAFVRDAQHNYATFADSTGSFMLKADPASSLQAEASNYKTTQAKIDGKTKIDIVLPAGENAGNLESIKSIKETINGEFLRQGQLLFGGDASQQQVKQGFVQEPTRGSRYLYADWIPGYGINKNDGLIAELSNMYNYDKIAGNIMYTNDGKSMAAISTDQVKTFILFEKGQPHVYENSPAIDGKKFVEVLLSTPKYKIYKKMDTKLDRADFHTDGVVTMGHRYDEYNDVERYYFVGEDGKAKSISLKKSSLKKIMGGDADAFIASQGSRDVDEQYVKDLGSSLAK